MSCVPENGTTDGSDGETDGPTGVAFQLDYLVCTEASHQIYTLFPRCYAKTGYISYFFRFKIFKVKHNFFHKIYVAEKWIW